jgi:glyoxylase-like metal-dependent hydrolase (beta-lactamase superfamily II)
MTVTAAAQDARSILQAAQAAMGLANVKSIQYSATGSLDNIGQGYNLEEEWPQTEIKSYTRTIDYDSKSMKQDMVRVQGNNPVRGGGFPYPIRGEHREVNLVSDRYAWNLQGDTVVPAPAEAELRQLEIWMTPPGFLKAALTASNAIVTTREEEGTPKTLVRITVLGKYPLIGMFNDQNLIDRVQTWIPNPVMGDMKSEIQYSDYRDFGGVKFPTHFHQHLADHPLNRNQNYFDIRVRDVQINVPNAALVVPNAVRQATIPPVRVVSQELADGVWFMGGGSHNSVVVEFRDYIAVVEAPLNEERSIAVINEIRKLAPGKPIRYVVNTHHHFDHLGGVRTYVSEGAAVITHQSNRAFYEQIVLASSQSRTLQPDRLSLFPLASTAGPNNRHREPAQVILETFTDKYTLTDGVRVMEIHATHGPGAGFQHVGNMSVAYLLKEKIVVEADLYSPPAEGAPATNPTPDAISLYQNLRRLKLGVAQIAPLHGRVVTMEEFTKFVTSAGGASTTVARE